MKNKSFKKAALPVLSALFASVLALTSVTYAWFTAGDSATVDTINVGVQTAGGLQISLFNVDEENQNGKFVWSSAIKPDLEQQVLAPVSGSINSNDLRFFTATYRKDLDKVFNVGAAEDAKKSYVTFDLYFKNAENSIKTINIDDTKVESKQGYSAYASRIGFVEKGTVSAINTSARPGDCSDTAARASIFEPNATTHTTYGGIDYNKNKGTNTGKFEYFPFIAGSEANYLYDRYTGAAYVEADEGFYVCVQDNNGVGEFREYVYADDFKAITKEEAQALFINKPTDVIIYTKASETEFNSVDFTADAYEPTATYYTQKAATRYDKVENAAKIMDAETAITTFDDIENGNAFTFELAPQTITKVTIYIWIEGQDADCEDSVAGFSFNVDLKFNVQE